MLILCLNYMLFGAKVIMFSLGGALFGAAIMFSLNGVLFGVYIGIPSIIFFRQHNISIDRKQVQDNTTPYGFCDISLNVIKRTLG